MIAVTAIQRLMSHSERGKYIQVTLLKFCTRLRLFLSLEKSHP
jgi:hypothetical protein